MTVVNTVNQSSIIPAGQALPQQQTSVQDNKPKEGVSAGKVLAYVAGTAAVAGAIYGVVKYRNIKQLQKTVEDVTGTSAKGLKLSPKVLVEKIEEIAPLGVALDAGIAGKKLSEAKAFLKQSADYQKYSKLTKEIKPTADWMSRQIEEIKPLRKELKTGIAGKKLSEAKAFLKQSADYQKCSKFRKEIKPYYDAIYSAKASV